MKYKLIFNLLSWACFLEAGFLTLPAIVALIYKEDVLSAYLITIGIGLLIGSFFKLISSNQHTMHAKEGLYAVALCWILLSIIGAIPFVISNEIPFFIDALFEIVSGFTTTGASILTDVESLSHASLIWRSFSHWIGGMGILVFMLIILPSRKGNGSIMHLMKAESPGPSVEKLVPKIRQTAAILYGIYFFLTVVMLVILLIAKMPLFDAISVTFGTAGTGGFSIKNTGLADYTSAQQIIVTVFMVLFGINFSFFYLLMIRKFKQAFSMSEVRAYIGIILIAISLITINILHMFDSVGEALKHVAFQVSSIITTTGFSTTDFNQWPMFSQTILVILMFIGACAGSTGGGFKVSRILLLIKGIKNEFSLAIHPRSIRKVKMDGHTVEPEVIRSLNSYLALYVIIFVLSVLVVSIDNMDLVTNFTAVAATFNNIGPGLNVVGPMGNFSTLSWLSKLVLIFDMLAGRLELIPIIMLFAPRPWKR